MQIKTTLRHRLSSIRWINSQSLHNFFVKAVGKIGRTLLTEMRMVLSLQKEC